MNRTIPLFWRSSYANVQDPNSFLAGVCEDGSFKIDDTDQGFRTWMVIARSETGLRSPCRATFGGAWSRVDECLIPDLVVIVSGLKAMYSGTKLSIQLASAHILSFQSELQRQTLEKLGGAVEYVDKSYFINVNDWSIEQMSKGNRKKIRQWRELGGKIREADLSELPLVYEVIRANRESLGVKPSISFADLETLIHNFPDEYRIYLGIVSEEIASAAVIISNTTSQDYVFFWADATEFRYLSPVASLCQFLINETRERGRSVLDLGTAQDRGVDNPGLIRFKLNLGAVPADKPALSILL